MQKFVINGRNKLKGEIQVSGAKNSALKLIAAAVLTEEEVKLTNVPDIEDIGLMLEIFKDLGGKVETISKNGFILKAKEIKKTEINCKLAAKLRSSILFLGPLLARFGEVKFPHPGGCIIGQRPIDIFLAGFKAMGAKVEEKNDHYYLSGKLRGAKFVFPWISVTVTETLILAATLAEGTMTLIDAALEPEIEAMAEFLNGCGAKIVGAGTPVVKIEGVKKIGGGTFRVVPDRIETGSFAILGALLAEDLKITSCRPDDLEVFLKMLEKAGVKFERGENYLRFRAADNNLKACQLRTREYPGFPTDLQPPFTVLLTQARGASLVFETVYEGRLFYTDVLNRMGANIIMCDPHRVVVNGPTKLYSHKMESPDIRAGIALVIAALIAEGKSEIENIYQIDRGYEDLERRLAQVGADIKRVEF